MPLQLSQSQAGLLGPCQVAVKMQAAAGRHALLLLDLPTCKVSASNSPLGLLQHRSCLRVQQSLVKMHVLARGLAAVHYLLEALLQAAAILAGMDLQGSQHAGGHAHRLSDDVLQGGC